MKELTKKEIESYKINGSLTVGKLKRFLEKHNLPDDAVVMTQVVEDVYRNENGWGVYLKKGHWYHSQINFNKNMKEEIDRRERGEDPEYEKMEDPRKFICEDEEKLKGLKEKYHPAWSCVKYNDEDEILFINLHY